MGLRRKVSDPGYRNKGFHWALARNVDRPYITPLCRYKKMANGMVDKGWGQHRLSDNDPSDVGASLYHATFQ